MWPGTISSAAVLRNGGTVLYALLALAGDVGCSAGPAVVGLVSGMFSDNLKTGILAAAIFPVLLLISLLAYRNNSSHK
jgi:MFS-type transporter involved in bile tolerance (Atg22 family)